MEDIKVSICYITYNQEIYIKEAMDSFLMQKVDFPIEILVHDDASTDNTVKILKEYEQMYPDIINPIYQTENQHSQGIQIYKINNERAKGKYIAICDGDDYWTDPYKLQKQVDYLEEHEECSLVVHDANVINDINNRIIKNLRPSTTSRTFSVEEIILGEAAIFPTNSMVFRNEHYKTLPDFFNIGPVEDYPLELHLSLLGEIYYMDEIMSDYRFMARGSWNVEMDNDMEKKVNHLHKVANMLDEMDAYSGYKYSDIIQRTKNMREFVLLVDQGKIVEAKKNDKFGYYLSLDMKRKLIINMKQYLPRLTTNLRKIKRKIVNSKPRY